MKWCSLTLITYERGLLSPVNIGNHCMRSRRGFWLEAIDNDGTIHRGECAPLPGWHRETLFEATLQVRRTYRDFLNSMLDLESFDIEKPYFNLWQPEQDLFPSVRTAYETLLFSMAAPWKKNASWSLTASSSVRLCGLLQLPPFISEGEWVQRIESLLLDGIDTFKIKVGRSPAEDEKRWLDRLLVMAGKPIKLRFDLNTRGQFFSIEDLNNWSQVLPVDYWEELAGEIQIKARNIGCSLAADESLRNFDPGVMLPDASVFVLKPNSLGLQRTILWMLRGQAADRRLVLSNCYESEWSLHFYGWLYACLVSKQEAIGLGTLTSFCDAWNAPGLHRWQQHGGWPQEPFAAVGEFPFVEEREVLWLA